MNDAASARLAALSSARVELRRSSTIVRLADVLRGQIAAGVLPPGMRLAEASVAEALGVSRNTLREAFRLLTQERLLVHEVNRGVFVRRPSQRDVAEVYAARTVVECAVVAGAGDLDHADLEPVWSPVRDAEEQARNGVWQAVGTSDLRFHAALVGLAGNRHLDELMNRLLAELRLAFLVMGDMRRFHEPYVRRNRQIAQSLTDREPLRAASELAEYLDDARDQIVEALATR